ncbi:MAG TPA: hypothetical protein VK539_33150 [Myxococcaceae bacterium]|nr:hypothetical protein [Myxococcaceae bacterium]
MPEGPFHLVLCRNVAFTYFAPPPQEEVLSKGVTGLERAAGPLPVFRKRTAGHNPLRFGNVWIQILVLQSLAKLQALTPCPFGQFGGIFDFLFEERQHFG